MYRHFAYKAIIFSTQEKETESFEFNLIKSRSVFTLRFHRVRATVGMVLSCIKKEKRNVWLH